ncbi:hypothetical protein Tco_0983922 [Tanacetum coccineum]
MALKQQIIDRLNEEIDADMKTINRITTLLRELLVDGDQREESIEEIQKLPLTRLHQYAHLYLVLLNEKDCNKNTNFEPDAPKNVMPWAVAHLALCQGRHCTYVPLS